MLVLKDSILLLVDVGLTFLAVLIFSQIHRTMQHHVGTSEKATELWDHKGKVLFIIGSSFWILGLILFGAT